MQLCIIVRCIHNAKSKTFSIKNCFSTFRFLNFRILEPGKNDPFSYNKLQLFAVALVATLFNTVHNSHLIYICTLYTLVHSLLYILYYRLQPCSADVSEFK